MTDLPTPMLATAADHLPPDGDDWAYEMKWDGYRAIVEVADGHLRIVSRRGNDLTARYPELSGLTDAVDVDVVLDGELVVLDETGRPSFQELQQHTAPAAYFCFDVLRLDGRDVTALPWHERRALLDRLALSSDRWQTPPATVRDGTRTSDTARALGLEGVVAKRVDSPYTPGKRVERVAQGAVHPPTRARGRWLAAGRRPTRRHRGLAARGLLRRWHAGVRRSRGLGPRRPRRAMRSHVSWCGATPRPSPRRVPRLPDAVWVEPDVVAEVRFSEWTTDGVLRQPVFLGLRDDKPPRDVVREG